MKTACLVIALALMVMTVASSRYRRVRSRRTRKVYEDPNPCDQACHDVCCEGDCGTDSNLKAVCDTECGCRKRTLQGLMTERRRTFFEDPNPCDQACHYVCCEGECGTDSNLKAVCDTECGCRKRTLQDPNPCDQACYDDCCEGECTAGSERKDICSSECGCRKRTLEDPNPCDQACHDRCCERECGTDPSLKTVCDNECGCLKRTLEDPNPCDQACYNDCCEGECTAGSERKDVCSSECGCRKRTLQALKTKRGDDEYPIDTEYTHVSPEKCAACKENCKGHSDVVCREICAC